MNALKKIMQLAEKDRELSPRYRDRRAHYASDALTCVRDQFWSLTGEPPTNKVDFLGLMKMAIGKAIETVLIADWLKQGHHVGLHHIADQVQVGSSTPVKWDGSIDALVYDADDKKPYAVEIKTKSGFGASMLKLSFDPGLGYLAQIGLYLKDLSEKKVTNKGCFIFVLLANDCFGDMIQIDCKYENGQVIAYQGTGSWGETKLLSLAMSDEQMFAHFKQVDAAMKTKQTPSPSYRYKTPLNKRIFSILVRR
jgi:hypothetical protein